MKLFVLADRDTVAGFASAGVRGRTPAEGKAREVFRETVGTEGIGVIVVTQEVAAELGGILWEHRYEARLPLVVQIPGATEPPDQGLDLMAFIREAVGISL